MIKFVKVLTFVAVLFIVGCTNKVIEDYNDDDIAAIVRGEEITVGELRILYTNEKALDMINSSIKAKLVIQELKQMNLDVADEIEQETEAIMKDLLEDSDGSSWESIRDFAEVQSESLGMTKKRFYQEYIELSIVQNVTMNAYVQEVLGEAGDEMADVEAYNNKVNDLLNELVTKNKEEIEIIIK